MTADIETVLSRLRERPECRDAVEVIERLTAERDRLRERMAAALDHCIGWHGSCCPCDGGPDGEEPCMDDLLGESPVPDEPPLVSKERLVAFLLGEEQSVWLYGGDQGSEDSRMHASSAAMLAEALVAFLAAPTHPTGEERYR